MTRRLLGSRRQDAETYLLITVSAFAVTVVAVRWYLELTGYPKIGGGGLHVAHMLWGGLLLVVGALIPLLFVGRRSLFISAAATGAGVGLFIDEVGKFITETNDYFFAPAAPLIYGAVLLLILLWLVVRERAADTPVDVLQQAVEALGDAADRQLTSTRRDRIVARLGQLGEGVPGDEAHLASQLCDVLRSPALEATLRPPGWIELGGPRSAWERLMPMRLERVLILLGLAWNALLGLLSSLVLLAAMDVGGLGSIADPGGPVEVPDDPFWALLLFGLGVLVGLLSVAALLLMLRGHHGRGTGLAQVAMLVSLVAGGLLTFYVVQFGAVASTLIHLALLGLILDHRSRLGRA